MIVEFKTVRSNIKELFDKERNVELGGQPEFHNHFDYTASFFLELDEVIDFVEGKVYINGKSHTCVYARLNDEETPNLLILPEAFKSLLEYTRNIKINTAEEILNRIKNENNPTSI